MKHFVSSLFFKKITALFFWGSLVLPFFSNAFGNKTIIIPRSPAINAARIMVGWQDQINLCDMCENYGSFNINAEYMRTISSKELSCYLLGGDRFVFSGSLVENRGPHDILADYFGLPLDFQSTVCFKPFMSNFVVDFSLYTGLDCLVQNLYVTVDLPIVHDTWSLELNECVAFTGTATTPAGYMSSEDIPRVSLPKSVRRAFEGTTNVGDVEPLKYGKIFGREAKTHISDIQCALGYNFFCDDWYHAGLNARLYIPTGSCIQPEFLFNPITGDARHWQAGIGFSGHVDFWTDYCVQGGLYLDANFTHLFPAQQLRPYDLKTGPGSRYILLEAFAQDSADLFVNGQPTAQQYASSLVPAINKTTLCSKIKVNVQTDLALKLALTYESLTFDIGYGLWVRSKEILMCRQKFPAHSYAIKGDAQIYGFTGSDQPIPLSATEHAATITAAQGTTNFVAGHQLQNLNVDNPAQAQGPTAGTPLLNITSTDAAFFGYAQTNATTSNGPLFVSDADINECSTLAPRALSQKLFLHLNNAWYANSDDYVPYLGVGGEAEWRTGSKNNSALSQWGIWIKGGISFS